MLVLRNVSKSYPARSGKIEVLKCVNLTVYKGERIAILGRNGAGKSTLMRLIGGMEKPDQGLIKSSMSISWPLGYAGGMQGSLTGIDNIIFLCRIYSANPNQIIDFIKEFTELGKFLKEPVKTYSAGMRGRLNFALSMAFDFDCLLIDEGLSAGDSRFNDRCRQALEKKKAKTILMVSHAEESIREFCNQAHILHDGKLQMFTDIEEALKAYKISKAN